MTENIKISREGRVVYLTFDRPNVLNALDVKTMIETVNELEHLDRDQDVGCFVIRGSQKSFAAGADINEMSNKDYQNMFYEDFLAGWQKFAKLRTPKIAAVSGLALGGGCEVAMMCDFIIAGKSAKFGQPEITLGVIPGMGGSQRLTRLIGKAKAMDLILTGRIIDAQEALEAGLVARVVDDGKLIEETSAVAEKIASFGKMTAMVAREAVERALEGSLEEGLLFERRSFHALFATKDQKEGMASFLAKRQPIFVGS